MCITIRRIALLAAVMALWTGVAHSQTKKNLTKEDRQKLVDEDLARFQGTWRAISSDGALGKVPAEDLRSNRVTYRDNLKTVTVGKRVIVKDVTIELDPASTPKRINESTTTPDGESVTITGIYKIEGDTLTTCVALPGQVRPTRFLGGPRAGATLQVFQRSEAASDAQSKRSPTAGAVAEGPGLYVSQQGRYRFRFPGKPAVADQRSNSASGPIVIHAATYEAPDGTAYMASYFDLAPASVRATSPDTLLEGAVRGMVASGGWKVTRKKAIKLGEYPGRDLIGEVSGPGAPETAYARSRMFLVGNRFYQLVLIGSKSKVSPADFEKCLDSFELQREAPAVTRTGPARRGPDTPAVPNARRPGPPMVKRAPRPGDRVATRSTPRNSGPVATAIDDSPGPDPSEPAAIAIEVDPAPARLVQLPREGTRRRGRGDDFRETAPRGGLLVGVRVGYVNALGGSKVGSIQPIFQAGGFYVAGGRAGAPVPGETTIVAKPGYAVGGVNTRMGLLVDAVQLVFMKYDNGRLNPKDSYASPWLGDPGGGNLNNVSGDGKIVLGIHGVTNHREVNSLGLLIAE